MNADFSQTEVSIEQLHWMIHQGLLFNVTDTTTGASPVVFLVKVGSKALHMRYMIESGAACTIAMNETVTASVDGSAKTVVNYNRNSANTILTTWFKGPTITVPGTTIETDQSGFGTSQGKATSGTNFPDIEYVLKNNTNYTITLTPGTSTTVIFKAVMYEP